LRLRTGPRFATEEQPARVSVAQIVADLEQAGTSGQQHKQIWRLSWEAEAELRLRSQAMPKLAAA
jgi:hypothetical protein